MELLQLLNDNPCTRDKLGFDRMADILCRVIKSQPDLPFTIGIFGEWGCGKTSLMKMIQKNLETDNKELHKIDSGVIEKLISEGLIKDKTSIEHRVYSKEDLTEALKKNDFTKKAIEDILKYTHFKIKTVWFNAWKYDEKEVIWNALIQTIFYTMKNDKKFKDNKELHDNLMKISWDFGAYALKFGAKVGINYLLKETKPITDALPEGIPLKDITSGDIIDKGLELISPLFAGDKHFDFINKFEDKFDKLVKKYVEENGRLVIFIDDLDRCLPENAITVMEALKLYLDRGNCVFVIGAESSIVEEGIRQRYKKNKRLSAKEYLEKIIQLPFSMRGCNEDRSLSLLELYKDKLFYKDDITYNEIMKKLIIKGTLCNPRRIKRFTNCFLVLSEIAGGKLNENERHHLAKILLIQIHFPTLYYAVLQNLEIIKKLQNIIGKKTKLERDNQLDSPDTPPVVKELYKDEELIEFLKETLEISCDKKDIERWVLLTDQITPLKTP